MLRIVSISLLALMACGRESAIGTEIQPNSIVISLDKDLSELKEGREIKREPILLDVPLSSSFHNVGGLLNTLVNRGYVNVSFLVSKKAVSIPILMAHGCACLWFYDGPSVFNEHSSSRDHLWIEARAGAGGSLHVRSLRIGVSRGIEEPIPIKNGKRAFEPLPREDEWKGEHPPLGVWELNTLEKFLCEPRVRSLSPFVVLEIRGDEKLYDVLTCLSSARSVSGPNVVVEMKLSEK